MGNRISSESYYMNVVKFIGIIMVVAGHTGFNLFDLISIPYGDNSELFPAYSYHMPLFIFISGYFFNLGKNNNLKSFINKKISTLIVPYYMTNVFYGVFTSLLVAQGLFTKSEDVNLYNIIIEPWVSGYQFNLNGPGWFVLFIFLVQVIYLLIRTSFGFQFYHMGYMYRKYLKGKVPLNMLSFITLIIIKLIFIEVAGNYTFSMRALVFRNSVVLPLIVSILGIYYVLYLAKFILYISSLIPSSYIKDVINYIGSNTWAIMMHHMTVNFMYIKIIGVGNDKISDFFIRPIVCLGLPLVWSKVYDSIKLINKNKNKKQSKSQNTESKVA
ncbi:MAG: acyltransferase family protein [Peptostreptococcaceae bacterium]